MIGCAQKIRMKLGANANVFDQFLDKPKRMHRRTYQSLRTRVLEA